MLAARLVPNRHADQKTNPSNKLHAFIGFLALYTLSQVVFMKGVKRVFMKSAVVESNAVACTRPGEPDVSVTCKLCLTMQKLAPSPKEDPALSHKVQSLHLHCVHAA